MDDDYEPVFGPNKLVFPKSFIDVGSNKTVFNVVWNRFVEKYFPRFSKNKLELGIYQGWSLVCINGGLCEHGEVGKRNHEEYLSISAKGNGCTVLSRLEKIGEKYRSVEDIVLNVPHYKVRRPDFEELSFEDEDMAFDRIGGLDKLVS